MFYLFELKMLLKRVCYLKNVILYRLKSTFENISFLPKLLSQTVYFFFTKMPPYTSYHLRGQIFSRFYQFDINLGEKFKVFS